jgi:LacI family transcriptional regulator
MTITLVDIAKQAGVSRATVGWVLSGRGKEFRISEGTREKVMKISRELNYRPSFSGRALAKGKTFSLGLICGDIHTPYYAELASKALHFADARGYHLMVSLTEWDFQKEVNCLEMFLGGKVDGVVMLAGGLQPGTPQYDYVVEKKFPLVLINTRIEGLSGVCSDFQPGMDQAIGYLKNKGHRRVQFLGYRFPVPMTDYKQIAFERACRDHGMDFQVRQSSSNLHDVRQIGRELAKDPNRSTAVIAFSDYVATGLINGLRDEGLAVPEDMAVVGIDGTEMGSFYYPPLTTIAVDIEGKARKSIELLLQLVEDRSAGPQEMSLPTELIIRGSA